MSAVIDAVPKCAYCGLMRHAGVCPMVKAIEYYPDGSVRRVEFKGMPDYMQPASHLSFTMAKTTNANATQAFDPVTGRSLGPSD